MKNKRLNRTDDFRQFKTKIFIRTVWIAAMAAGCIFLLYSLFLKGRFADWIVAANQKLFRLDYGAAKTLYQWTFRNHVELVFVAGMALVFFMAFRIYLNWFARYFIEINRGIDEIGREDSGEASLPPELSATEKRINAIKHRIEKQKLDMKLAEQQKNDMVMYLAHDLKTPLSSVIGYLTLLRDESQISEELRKKYLSISLDKAERLEDLINEFFEITRFNISNITLQYTKINLTRLLEQLLYEFKPMLNEKNLQCNLCAADDIMLRCDADKIQRVLDNLLRNAVIYSFENTEITISAQCQEDTVSIIFCNHSDTLPEEKLNRIFEQFYRLDAARSTGSGGAGLGLAIAKQIVELHNGTIVAESQEEQIKFSITLPLS